MNWWSIIAHHNHSEGANTQQVRRKLLDLLDCQRTINPVFVSSPAATAAAAAASDDKGLFPWMLLFLHADERAGDDFRLNSSRVDYYYIHAIMNAKHSDTNSIGKITGNAEIIANI